MTTMQPQKTLKTPVAFLIFNRPDVTQKVFNEIRKARPEKLFVIADGPRNKEDNEKCFQTRSIIDQIDWKCEIHKNYSDTNMGCKNRVSSGLDWVFTNNEEAIILEDDCLPNQSFFWFCQELLEKYRHDNKVMHISGDNFQFENKNFKCNESYYFTHIPHIWGWASWKRAWKLYDVNINEWPKIKSNNKIKEIFKDDATTARWEDTFQNYYEQKVDSWDGQWSFTCIANDGVCIVPKVNLVSNLGFGKEATHTTSKDGNKLAMLSTQTINFPLIHPATIKINENAEEYVMNYIFNVQRYAGVTQKLRRFLKKNFEKQYIIMKRLLKREKNIN